MPVEHQPEVKAAYWSIFDPTGEPPGEGSIAAARRHAAEFSDNSGGGSAAVACLNEDLASLFADLRFPVEHHKRIRHANFIEHTFAGGAGGRLPHYEGGGIEITEGPEPFPTRPCGQPCPVPGGLPRVGRL